MASYTIINSNAPFLTSKLNTEEILEIISYFEYPINRIKILKFISKCGNNFEENIDVDKIIHEICSVLLIFPSNHTRYDQEYEEEARQIFIQE